jgi:hypothetical protein
LADDVGRYTDFCEYDAESELVAMLDRDDLGLKQVDRSRIVEVLADIDEAKSD